MNGHEPVYSFEARDGIRHCVWRVDEPETVARMEEAFGQIPATYIADGHHRAASAVKVTKAQAGESGLYRPGGL